MAAPAGTVRIACAGAPEGQGFWFEAKSCRSGSIADETTWLQLLCGLPFIGDWATTIVGLVPPVLLVMGARSAMGWTDDNSPWILLTLSLLLIPWLIFLERWQRLRIDLPYVPIKLLWVCPVLFIAAVVELMG